MGFNLAFKGLINVVFKLSPADFCTYERFEVLIVVLLKIQVFQHVTL
jgi:hypothetical protein